MTSLKTYLRINSIFSLVSGILMAQFSDQLLYFFDIEIDRNKYIFDILGAGLIIFSIFVWYVSSKQLNHKPLIRIISLLDMLWVTCSLIIVIFQLFNLSVNGYLLISIVALWIAFLGYKQLQLLN